MVTWETDSILEIQVNWMEPKSPSDVWFEHASRWRDLVASWSAARIAARSQGAAVHAEDSNGREWFMVGKWMNYGDKTSNFKIFLGSLCMDIAARKLSGFLSLHCMTKHCRSYGDEILQNNTLLSMARDAQLQVVAGRCKVFQCFSGQHGYLCVEI